MNDSLIEKVAALAEECSKQEEYPAAAVLYTLAAELSKGTDGNLAQYLAEYNKLSLSDTEKRLSDIQDEIDYHSSASGGSFDPGFSGS